MVRFVLCLYILMANGFVVPDAVLIVSLVFLAVEALCACVNAIIKVGR